jgi:hypothetical protein
MVDCARGTITQQVPRRWRRCKTPGFLTLIEREQVADLRARGVSIRAVAAVLGRPPSTISRELAATPTLTRPRRFTGLTRPTAPPPLAGPEPSRPSWSPTAHWPTTSRPSRISAGHRSRSAVDHPEDREMRVCPETIYQALYPQARGGLRREVAAALRTGRTRRKPHRDPATRAPGASTRWS